MRHHVQPSAVTHADHHFPSAMVERGYQNLIKQGINALRPSRKTALSPGKRLKKLLKDLRLYQPLENCDVIRRHWICFHALEGTASWTAFIRVPTTSSEHHLWGEKGCPKFTETERISIMRFTAGQPELSV
jgi:hypothetical protein